MPQPPHTWQQIAAEIRAAAGTRSWKELGKRFSAARKEYLRMKAAGGIDLMEVNPSMLRRCYSHDYSSNGSYMITIVANDREQLPFGKVKGNPAVAGPAFTLRPDGSVYSGPGVAGGLRRGTSEHNASCGSKISSGSGASSFSEEGVPAFINPDTSCPYMHASAKGIAVLEALAGISANYPMVEVRQAQLMPDHMHIILVVHGPIVSRSGRAQHLGQVIAGYKKGCNRAVWAITNSGSNEGVSSFPEEKKPVWSKGYTDTIVGGERTLGDESAYLNDNCRRLRIKQLHKDLFRTVRHICVEDPEAPGGCRDYAALGNIFLLKRAWREQVQYHQWEDEVPEGFVPCYRSWNCERFYRRNSDGSSEYFTKGEAVAKSQADAHTEQVLRNGDAGAVHISPFISDMEKAVRDALLTMGCDYIRLTKEGFTDLYTPSKSEFYACAEGHLLILAPWEERKRKEKITRAECLELNRQALFLSKSATRMWLVLADGSEEVLSVLDD